MTLLLIALGVAMDATAVAGGMAIRGAHARDVLKLAVTFGVFQFVMSLAGAFGGVVIEKYLSSFDHWIAFGLLAVVGGKMLWEAFSHDEEREPFTGISLAALLMLGVATSIDALAVGATLPTLDLPSAFSAAVIGLVTFGFSFGGAWAGKKLGERLGTSLEVVGGLVLIGIGVKTLVEHLSA